MTYRKDFSDIFDDDFEVIYEDDEDNWGYDDIRAVDGGYEDTEYEDGTDSRRSKQSEPPRKAARYNTDEYDVPPRRAEKRRKKRGVPLAAPIRKGGRVLSRVTSALIRCLTAVIILATTAYVTYTFWRASTPYGDVSESVRTREMSMTLAAYLSVAAIFILSEFIALLWSMTRTRVRDGYDSWKEDTGRGLVSFIVVFGTSYLSFLLYRFIPEAPEVLYGLKGALDVYGSMHNVLLGLCTAGVISCLVRKYF